MLTEFDKKIITAVVEEKTNKELADWLLDNDGASELTNCKMCLFCASTKYDNGEWKCIQCCDEDFECKEGILQWLNQEIKEVSEE